MLDQVDPRVAGSTVPVSSPGFPSFLSGAGRPLGLGLGLASHTGMASTWFSSGLNIAHTIRHGSQTQCLQPWQPRQPGIASSLLVGKPEDGGFSVIPMEARMHQGGLLGYP